MFRVTYFPQCAASRARAYYVLYSVGAAAGNVLIVFLSEKAFIPNPIPPPSVLDISTFPESEGRKRSEKMNTLLGNVD